MNVKPFIFATTFNDVYDTLEEFLEWIIEMIYSPNIHLGLIQIRLMRVWIMNLF